MKVFKRSALAASLLCFAGVIQAQNPVMPGELAKNVALASPFDSTAVDVSTVMPKQKIAYVETSREKRVRVLWMTSIAAMAAGTAADAYSSWHKRESNSLLASSNGTFGEKGVAIKAGIAAGVLTPQILFRKHRDWHLAFAVSNFAEAGIFAGATVHNLNVK